MLGAFGGLGWRRGQSVAQTGISENRNQDWLVQSCLRTHPAAGASLCEGQSDSCLGGRPGQRSADSPGGHIPPLSVFLSVSQAENIPCLFKRWKKIKRRTFRDK